LDATLCTVNGEERRGLPSGKATRDEAIHTVAAGSPRALACPRDDNRSFDAAISCAGIGAVGGN
jgi:hypothetical protein